MTAVNRYSIEFDGQTFTRNTNRVYTHVVLGKRPGDLSWTALGWRSRGDLAHRSTSEFRRQRYVEFRIVAVA